MDRCYCATALPLLPVSEHTTACRHRLTATVCLRCCSLTRRFTRTPPRTAQSFGRCIAFHTCRTHRLHIFAFAHCYYAHTAFLPFLRSRLLTLLPACAHSLRARTAHLHLHVPAYTFVLPVMPLPALQRYILALPRLPHTLLPRSIVLPLHVHRSALHDFGYVCRGSFRYTTGSDLFDSVRSSLRSVRSTFTDLPVTFTHLPFTLRLRTTRTTHCAHYATW